MSLGWPSHTPLVRYENFQYQADSWTTARRAVAKVEHHVGEPIPRVGFIVTNLPLQNPVGGQFYNKRGPAEAWIKEGKQAARWSCHRFRANEVRLNLGSSLAAVGAPEADRHVVVDQPPGSALSRRVGGW